MKNRFIFLLILGFSYFYTLSSAPMPFLIKNYLAIVPFQLAALVYFIYFFSSRNSRRIPEETPDVRSQHS